MVRVSNVMAVEVISNERALDLLRTLRNKGCRGKKVAAFFAEKRFTFYETILRRWIKQHDLVTPFGERGWVTVSAS